MDVRERCQAWLDEQDEKARKIRERKAIKKQIRAIKSLITKKQKSNDELLEMLCGLGKIERDSSQKQKFEENFNLLMLMNNLEILELSMELKELESEL